MMKTKLSRLVGAAAVVIAAGAVSRPLLAWEYTPSWQSSNPYSSGWVNPYDNTLVNGIRDTMNMQMRHSMQRSELYTSQLIARNSLRSSMRRGGSSKRYSAREKKEIDRFAKFRGTMFKPSGTRIMPDKLAATFVKQPGKARENCAKVFTQFLDLHDQLSKKNGAPSNDLARNMSMAIGYSYGYYSGQGDVAQSGLDNLRTKLRRELTSNAGFRKMSDLDKQKLNESVLILGYLVAVGYGQAYEAKDKKAQAGFQKLAGVVLQSLTGVEPNRVKLEKTGLVISE